jgi:hypothetical protein
MRVATSLAAPPTGSFATLTYYLAAPEPVLPLMLATGSAVLACAAVRRRVSPRR